MYKEEQPIIEPMKKKSLGEILATLEPLEEDFPDIEDPLIQDEYIF